MNYDLNFEWMREWELHKRETRFPGAGTKYLLRKLVPGEGMWPELGGWTGLPGAWVPMVTPIKMGEGGSESYWCLGGEI